MVSLPAIAGLTRVKRRYVEPGACSMFSRPGTCCSRAWCEAAGFDVPGYARQTREQFMLSLRRR